MGFYTRLTVKFFFSRPTKIFFSNGRAWSLFFQRLDSMRSIYEIALCFSKNNRLSSSTPDGALLARSLFFRQK